MHFSYDNLLLYYSEEFQSFPLHTQSCQHAVTKTRSDMQVVLCARQSRNRQRSFLIYVLSSFNFSALDHIDKMNIIR